MARGNDFRRGNFRQRADAVRSVPLESVLTEWGANRDRRDRSRWLTERGLVSITGSKFFNWQRNQGGGGAIDLVMHLSGMEAGDAVDWLERYHGNHDCSDRTAAVHDAKNDSRVTRRCLRLPTEDLSGRDRVRGYLTRQRGLAANIVEQLMEARKVYADRRGNAVFLMLAGKPNRPVGAELRGTGKQVWRGLAPGTSRDAGYFWIGQQGSRRIVLCESAIDAISCFQLQTARHKWQCICVSTAGVRPNAPWLTPLISHGYEIYCGFDEDEPGNAAARQMNRRYPSVERLRPPAHDWNDALLAGDYSQANGYDL